MSGFKVGDRVRFTQDVDDEFHAREGDEAVVVRFANDGLPILSTDAADNIYGWSRECLEVVDPSTDHTPTLRDQFAMVALTGYMSGKLMDDSQSASDVAGHAYWFADAMMAERERGK